MNQNAVNTIIANNYITPNTQASTGRVKFFNDIVNGVHVFAANNDDSKSLDPQINAAATGNNRDKAMGKSK